MRTTISLSKTNALKIAILINIIAMVIEFYFANITKSVMLYSDGIHMLSHVASLLISFLGIYFGSRKQNSFFYENLAALINGFGLLLFTFFIFSEAYHQYFYPEEIKVSMAMYIAVFGLVVNLFTAWILSLSGIEDINTKSAFLHLMADTFSSVSIIVGMVIIHYTNYIWIDALLSVVVGLVIVKWSFGLIKDSYKALRKVGRIVQEDNIVGDL
jgi:cobalt-zinc-cadmium efflux system protein